MRDKLITQGLKEKLIRKWMYDKDVYDAYDDRDTQKEIDKARAARELERQQRLADMERARLMAEDAHRREKERIGFEEVCRLIRARMLIPTEAYMRSIIDPKQKQKLVEAICMSKV